jgi:hypothetical protein
VIRLLFHLEVKRQLWNEARCYVLYAIFPTMDFNDLGSMLPTLIGNSELST